MKQRGAIGILGGMGPEASVYLHKLLIELSHERFEARHNDDFPEIIIHSVPVPDFISNDTEKKKACEMLKKRVVQMNHLNVTSLSIACNTAHLLLDDLQKVSNAPFTSMIDSVVNKVKADKVTCVGILATPSTLRSELYQDALMKRKIVSLVPETADYPEIEKVIRNVISGTATKAESRTLTKVADALRRRGAEGIILGCTELPLAFPASYAKLPVYNSVEILAMALLQNYYKSNTIG